MSRKLLIPVLLLLLAAGAAMAQSGARPYTWGPYQFDLGSRRNTSDSSPVSTVTVSETVHLAHGVVTITETRGAERGATVPPRTAKYRCTSLAARAKMKWLDQKTSSNDYLPAPLWEVDLTCKEGGAAVLFPVQEDATAFVRLITGVKKR